jgi:hypothetical protein
MLVRRNVVGLMNRNMRQNNPLGETLSDRISRLESLRGGVIVSPSALGVTVGTGSAAAL